MSFLDRLIANRAKKAMSDAGRILGQARIAKDAEKRNATTQRLRNCIDSGRIAHLGWPQ
ncbi:MAG TPA: hypothetical protein VF637_08005 [Sphingomicrobium sp.]